MTNRAIEGLNQIAEPMDIVLLGNDTLLGRLISNAQSIQTAHYMPSLWTHSVLYYNHDMILESTIDLEKYPGGSRLDNGVQCNSISKLKRYSRAMLIKLPIENWHRALLLNKARALKDEGITYSISGLLGSLLSLWLFGWQSNPLQTKHSLYCSAFIQEVYSVINVDFDPKHTARNTTPEIISQYEAEGVKKVRIV